VSLSPLTANRRNLGENRRVQAELLRELDGVGSECEIARGGMEGNRDLVVSFGNTADLVEKVHVPGSAAQLAVGDGLQSDFFLLLDEHADRRVFGRAQLDRRPPARLELRARLAQRWRSQQTADVVGPERWFGACGHGIVPSSARHATRGITCVQNFSIDFSRIACGTRLL
jgi:hypothetical protein